ncbi:hypothetical protein ES703_40193 [subsurface metagenome]
METVLFTMLLILGFPLFQRPMLHLLFLQVMIGMMELLIGIRITQKFMQYTRNILLLVLPLLLVVFHQAHPHRAAVFPAPLLALPRHHL